MTFTQGLALVVGVSSYKYEPRLNMPVASRDARAVSEVLLDRHHCGYPENQVIILPEERTTREHILEALDRVASRAERDNTVFMFFCGHGDYGTDGNYYLLCHDSRVEGNKVTAGTGIRQEELLQKLRAIEAQRLVMVFNSCHSGEISPSLSIDEAFGGRALPGETAEALLATGSGRTLITACREGQLSWIGSGNLSIFTQALTDAMRGKNITPRGGFISVFDLYTSLFQNVSSRMHNLLGVEQEPELTILKGVGPFAVALYRGATQTNLGAAEVMQEPPQGAAVRQVEPERSSRMYQMIVSQSGGINFGQGNRIEIQGDVTGKDKIEINTGGGAYVGGNVSVQGSDFVGRDKITHGDEVRGDKVSGDKITVGSVSGTGIAIGRGAQASVNTGITGADLDRLFAPILHALKDVPPEKQEEAVQKVEELKAEIAKGEKAEDSRMATLLDGLIELVPGAVTVVVSTFSTPILAAIAGPVTKYVLEKIRLNK
jgi:hypothetical protein